MAGDTASWVTLPSRDLGGEVPSHVSCTQGHSICGDPERAVPRDGGWQGELFLDIPHPRAEGKAEAASGSAPLFLPREGNRDPEMGAAIPVHTAEVTVSKWD